MKKVIFVIADYKDHRQDIFDNYLSPRNQKYCKHHGFEYKVIRDGIKHRGNYTWQKVFEIKKMIDEGYLVDGDYVCNMDADMCIVDGRNSIFPKENKSFCLAIDNGNTHCWGWISFHINDWSKNMIEQILNEERWERLKNTEHAINFREQAMWYYLCGIISHSWKPFNQMPFFGWHSNFNKNETYYSIDQLKQNVEIRGPEWNTTLLEEEQKDPISKMLQKYNIVKSKKSNTIIRHWAGSQPWNYEEYCSKDIIL